MMLALVKQIPRSLAAVLLPMQMNRSILGIRIDQRLLHLEKEVFWKSGRSGGYIGPDTGRVYPASKRVEVGAGTEAAWVETTGSIHIYIQVQIQLFMGAVDTAPIRCIGLPAINNRHELDFMGRDRAQKSDPMTAPQGREQIDPERFSQGLFGSAEVAGEAVALIRNSRAPGTIILRSLSIDTNQSAYPAAD